LDNPDDISTLAHAIQSLSPEARAALLKVLRDDSGEHTK
jgi:hypothetical protein